MYCKSGYLRAGGINISYVVGLKLFKIFLRIYVSLKSKIFVW